MQDPPQELEALRKKQRKEDKARFRKMQERLNHWVDQIELRVNEIDRKFRNELMRYTSTERQAEAHKSQKREKSKQHQPQRQSNNLDDYQPLRYTPAKSEDNRSANKQGNSRSNRSSKKPLRMISPNPIQRELDFKSLSTDRKRDQRIKKQRQSLGEDNPASLIRDVNKSMGSKNSRNKGSILKVPQLSREDQLKSMKLLIQNHPVGVRDLTPKQKMQALRLKAPTVYAQENCNPHQQRIHSASTYSKHHRNSRQHIRENKDSSFISSHLRYKVDPNQLNALMMSGTQDQLNLSMIYRGYECPERSSGHSKRVKGDSRNSKGKAPSVSKSFIQEHQQKPPSVGLKQSTRQKMVI
ncbi:hypothetical protein FGO68_gene11759 [Halteria grandinella]|uniref:Uncharacterized protein n=1 Tax=Halteria grandinella TaxID=5974 RepID=A0A8J8NUJ9_HALGN|nr:hypothetical protein FGO68_gene11759 [Halteria grandinella]